MEVGENRRTYYKQNGEVGASTVKTSSGKLIKRALNFLYSLECSEINNQKANPGETNDQVIAMMHRRYKKEDREEAVNKRTVRQAAIEARKTLINYRKKSNKLEALSFLSPGRVMGGIPGTRCCS